MAINYVKTVQLVPGKPQMTISHVLKNTGKKAHRHHRLLPQLPDPQPRQRAYGDHRALHLEREKPLQPELVKLDGKTIRYLAPIPKGVTTISLMNGFGDKASDYDFTVTNTKTGFGQRIRADQPIAKINMWSITPPTAWSPISPSRSSPARPSAGPIPTISLDLGRKNQNEIPAFAVLLLASTSLALAQGNAPFVPVNPARHLARQRAG